MAKALREDEEIADVVEEAKGKSKTKSSKPAAPSIDVNALLAQAAAFKPASNATPNSTQ